MKRILIYFLKFLLSLFLLSSLFIYVIFYTEMGLHAVIKIAKNRLTHLTIEKSSGSLAREVTLQNLHLKNANLELSTQQISLQFHPIQLLLFHHLIIDHLTSQNLNLSLNKKKSGTPWLH